jgi:hypothetical protein
MAEKKAAKKAAKKAPKHHDKKHHEGKDLRRAYEHLGRLAVLEKNLTVAFIGQIGTLTAAAQRFLLNGDHKNAADLLRAGEHLGFGSLGSSGKATRLSEELEAVLRAEYEHLTEKAADHWDKHEDERPSEVVDIYESMLAAAAVAFTKGAYRRALEFARGAEALAHVHGHYAPTLDEGDAKQIESKSKLKKKSGR